MAKITEEDIYCMKAQIECLPGLVAYVFDNYELLSKDMQEKFVGDCTKFMSGVDQALKTINDGVETGSENKIMCWEVMFDIDEAGSPLDMMLLDFKDVSKVTKHMYKPVPISWLGRTIRELNNYIQIYIPDPKHNLTAEDALKLAADSVNDYIINEQRKWTEWLRNSGKMEKLNSKL